MSLGAISEEVLVSARSGTVSEDSFIKVIRESLPEAWAILSSLAAKREQGEEPLFPPETLDSSVRNQLLRILASNSMRTAVAKHFDCVIGFQNCHKTKLFSTEDCDEYREFVSPRAQLLN